MKEASILKALLYSALFYSSCFASAPNPETVDVNPASGFFLSVQGGLGVTVVGTQWFYLINTVPANALHTESISPSALAATALYGINISYDFALTPHYSLEPSFAFNWLSGTPTILTRPGINPASLFQINDTTILKHQYDFVLALKRILENNVAFSFGLGFSERAIRSRVQAFLTDSALGAPLPASYFSSPQDKIHLTGGVIELGVQLFFSRHQSLGIKLNNYFYKQKELPTTFPGVSDTTTFLQQLDRTLRLMYTPAIVAQYAVKLF